MNDFLMLADSRGELKAEIDNLEERVKMLPTVIDLAPTVEEVTASNEAARKQLEELRMKVDKSEDDVLREKTLNKQIVARVETQESLQRELSEKN